MLAANLLKPCIRLHTSFTELDISLTFAVAAEYRRFQSLGEQQAVIAETVEAVEVVVVQ